MGQLVRLAEFRRKSTGLHFTRAELNQLLGVYSSRVIKGEWRDYSIGTTPGFARFCIYRSSREEPAFTITKLATEGRARSPLARKGQFMVTSQQRTLSQSNSLIEALQIFDRALGLVSH